MKLRTIALASAALLVLSPATVAGAAPPDSGGTLHEGLSFPLHLAVGPGKAVTVSESFVGKMTTVSKGKATAPYANDGWDVAGLDYHGSALFFVKSVGAGPDPRDMVGSLKAIDNKGNVTTITDQLAQFEIDHNVDACVPYGLSPEDAAAYPACVAMLAEGPNPASYTGAGVEVDSHVYGLAVSGNTAYVADAGANAVFSVNLTTGAIATVALLPAQTIVFPDGSPCAGLSYGFEAVPTDIEIGPDGQLYVALLPGGPEDPSLGARGSVYTVDPVTGAYELYVGGLMAPTGIALDGDGHLYVASPFTAGIQRIEAGTKAVSLFLPAAMTAGVEVSGSTLYATTHAMQPTHGTLVSKKL